MSNPFTSRQLRLPLGPGEAFKASFPRPSSVPRPAAPAQPVPSHPPSK